MKASLNGRVVLPRRASTSVPSFPNDNETMSKRRESKMREMDRETRLTGKWTGIGFVIVLLGALALALLLLGAG